MLTPMLSVAVLIDHPLENASGGLAQCWRNLSLAALALPKILKLDLHFLGEKSSQKPFGANVVYFTHPPLLGTRHLFFLKEIPDHTDLSPFNPWLWKALRKENYNIIHTTNTFLAFAKTGLHFAKRNKIPLANSIQTDMPRYTKLYTEKILGNFMPKSLAQKLAEKKYASSVRALKKYLSRCEGVLVSREEDGERARSVLKNKPLSFLRRGIDKSLFHPSRRDRGYLKDKFGIDEGRFVLLFVGRVDEGKNIMTILQATQLLLKKNRALHLLLVGECKDKRKIVEQLGPHVTVAGPIPHYELPFVYASSDLFLFPSQIEVFPNVVIEAKACGIPVLMTPEGGASQVIKEDQKDGLVIPSKEPLVWANEIEKLIQSKDRLSFLSQQARAHIEREWPTWEEVLQKDLLPVWQTLAS